MSGAHDDPTNDYAQTYFNIYYIHFRTCIHQSSSPDSLPDCVQIQRCASGCTGIQATSLDFDRYHGNVETWIRNLTSITPDSVTQPCWHCLPDASSPLCEGNCSFTQLVVALPTILLIEFPEIEDQDWFIPDRITIACCNNSTPEAILYELTSCVLFKREQRHYALRFHLKLPAGNRYHIYNYDDMDCNARRYTK